MLEMKLLWCT